MRAEEEGRIPTFQYICQGHFFCQQRFFELSRLYLEKREVDFKAIDNTCAPGKQKLVDIDFVRKDAYQSLREVEKRAEGAVRHVYQERAEQGSNIPQYITRGLFPRGIRKTLEGDRPNAGREFESQLSGRSGETQERGTLGRVDAELERRPEETRDRHHQRKPKRGRSR